MIGIVSLVVLGLLIADVATYTLLQKSLLSRIDSELGASHDAAVVGLGGEIGPGGRGPSSPFPNGTVVELVSPDGRVLLGPKWSEPQGSVAPGWTPVLPKTLPNAGMDVPAAAFTVP